MVRVVATFYQQLVFRVAEGTIQVKRDHVLYSTLSKVHKLL